VLDRKIKHLISQKVTVVKVKNLNFPPKMKSFALILSLSAAAVVAAPQYSVNNNNNNRPSRPSPQTQCRVIKDIEYREEFETKCQTIYDYQLCVPTSRKQCDNKRRQKCNDSWRTVYDTNYEKVCDDKPTQACEKHWQDDGKGGKIWANDPAGTCKTIYKTECRDEERKVPRQEKYETCNWETYPDCYQVAGPDDCKYVAKQQCYGRGNSVKGAKCNEQPKQDCTEVHKEVPHQVERRVCPGDSDWDDVRDNVGGSFSPSTIADAFNQATNQGTRNQGTRNDNKSNKVGGGQEIVPGVRSEVIDIKSVETVSVRSAGGSSGVEEEADPDSDAIVFG